jgi:hypothetical protein
MAEPYGSYRPEEAVPAGGPAEINTQAGYRPIGVSSHLEQGAEDMRNEAANNVSTNFNGIARFADTVGKGFTGGDNFAVQALKDLERIGTSGPADPEWGRNADAWIAENRGMIDPSQDWRYRQANNKTEAEAIMAQAAENTATQDILSRRGGVSTFVARGLAGIIDLDAPLMFMSGGLSLAAKEGILATRASRLMAGAGQGSVVGAAMGGVDYMADPASDWTVIPTIGLMGSVFGAAGGALSRGPVMSAEAARQATLNEFGESLRNGAVRAKEDVKTETHQSFDNWHSERSEIAAQEAREQAEAAAKAIAPDGAARQPAAIPVDQIERPGVADVELPADADQGKLSIGARQLGGTGPGIKSIRSTKLQDIIQTSKVRNRQLQLSTNIESVFDELATKSPGLAKAARGFHDMLIASPIASDYNKLIRSGSSVLTTLAYDTMESAAGLSTNGRSAARLKDMYQDAMLREFRPFHENYDAWAKVQHNAGGVQRTLDAELKNKYNREVAAELQARYHDGAPKTTDPHVKAAADAIDRVHALEVQISKGRPNETSVHGADALVETSGYMSQKWSGRNMRRMIAAGTTTADKLKAALAKSYMHMHPNLSKKDAAIYADATISRALKNDEGVNTSLINVLQGDGRMELADVLRRQGTMSDTQIDRFIERLTGTLEERGMASHMKHRMAIDLRASYDGINMMDLVDTDFSPMIERRSMRSAGQAALARKGIRSKQDWNDIVDAAMAEQQANGVSQKTGSMVDDALHSDKHVDREFMENLYTYFNGQPVAGGVSPVYARMKKLTNLALLNQLGLTQLAEFGVTISSVGVQQFFRHAGNEIRDAIKRVDSPLVQEMRHLNTFKPEEGLYRSDMVAEFEKRTTQSEFGRQADRVLNKLGRVQGFTSGFFGIRQIQQRIAVTSAADKLAKHFRDGKGYSASRFADMGFTKQDLAAFEQHIKNGTIEFDANGDLLRLNLDKWSPEDKDIFTMALNTNTNRLVQKAMIGESTMMFHKDGLAQLFFHLKSFPLLAMEKQLLRHAKHADTEAVMTFLYGLSTAAVAYSIKQAINGRTEKLNPEDIARGAFGLSNMTGWIPMWTDPLAGMLGLDSLKLGGYGGYGGQQVISTPAALPTLDRMIQIPGAIGGAILNGGPTNDQINALTATPIIGNAVGFSAMFNAMRQSNNAEKAELAREARRAQEAVAKKERPPAATVDQQLEQGAVDAGFADGAKYVQTNRDEGMSDEDIAAALGITVKPLVDVIMN